MWADVRSNYLGTSREDQHCGGCGIASANHNAVHCTKCHETFSGYQISCAERGGCLSPDELWNLGYRISEKGFWVSNKREFRPYCSHDYLPQPSYLVRHYHAKNQHPGEPMCDANRLFMWMTPSERYELVKDRFEIY
jgi:hypothetical protein